MPTYDYRCERTGEMFELWQSFSDDAITECPQTHTDQAEGAVCGAQVKKVFSKVGISFKGDGFYKNDHGSSAKKDSSSAASSNSSSSSSATSSSDSSSGSSDPGSSTSSSSDSSSSSTGSTSSSDSSSKSSSSSSSGSAKS